MHVFTSIFVAIYSAASHLFEFKYRIKRPTLEILKFIFSIFRNQDNKVALIQVDNDGAMIWSSEFMRTIHNKNIKVQKTIGYASSVNSKSVTPNKTLDIITMLLLMNSSQKKELLCLAYQYDIWTIPPNW